MIVDKDYGTAAAAVDCLSHHSFAIRQEEGSNHVYRMEDFDVEKAIDYNSPFSPSTLQ